MDSKAIDLFVGEKLKARRKELGLNQRELANQVKLSHQQVQKYERGENRVGASMLYTFSHVLAVNVAYFFEGYDVPNGSKKMVKRKNEMSFKYKDLNISEIEELIKIYASLPATARKNMLTLIKGLTLVPKNRREAVG